MKPPHYILRDRWLGVYLQEIRQTDGNPDHLLSVWVSAPAEALRFPGVKSARRMARVLDIDYEIINTNQRGRKLK